MLVHTSKQSLVSSVAKVQQASSARRLRDTNVTCDCLSRLPILNKPLFPTSLLPFCPRPREPTLALFHKTSASTRDFTSALALQFFNHSHRSKHLQRTTPQSIAKHPFNMANNSSDSSHAAASSDSNNDHPRTPSLAAVASRSRANTGRSSMAPSKIPKLSTASVSKIKLLFRHLVRLLTAVLRLRLWIGVRVGSGARWLGRLEEVALRWRVR